MDLNLKLAKLHQKQFSDEIENICRKYENVPINTSLLDISEGTVVRTKDLKAKDVKKMYFETCDSFSSSSSTDLDLFGRKYSDEVLSSDSEFMSSSVVTDEENVFEELLVRSKTPSTFCKEKAKDWDAMSTLSFSHFKSVAKVSKVLNSNKFKLDCLESTSDTDDELSNNSNIVDRMSDLQNSSRTRDDSFSDDISDNLALEPSNLNRQNGVNVQLKEASSSEDSSFKKFKPKSITIKCSKNLGCSFLSDSSESIESKNSATSNLFSFLYNKKVKDTAEIPETSSNHDNLTTDSVSNSSSDDKDDPLSNESSSQRPILVNLSHTNGVSKLVGCNKENRQQFHSPSSLLCSPIRSINLFTSSRTKETRKKAIPKSLQYPSEAKQKLFRTVNVKSVALQENSNFIDKTTSGHTKKNSFTFDKGYNKCDQHFSNKKIQSKADKKIQPKSTKSEYSLPPVRTLQVVLTPLHPDSYVNSKSTASKARFDSPHNDRTEVTYDDFLEISP